MNDTRRPLIRICHLADIHWRGLSRHDEYKIVFERFFKELRLAEPDVIHIGGDIFHTKTQNISPEIIQLISWWFKCLAEIAPVVVTLGNHDGNLMNHRRQDAITPIIELLADDRITLLKQSGTYRSHVAGVNWCVFSCFDEKGWATVEPIAGDVNIAFFHGSVKGSTTDQGHELKGEVSTSFFDRFDFALLGDIHKMQFLDHRVCVDGITRPWIGYCGSSIQQNYGEAIDHGFLVWDINARDDFDVRFVCVENPHRFVTLQWCDDQSVITDEVARHPVGSRFRIKSTTTIPQAAWRSLAQVLRRDHGASEVTARIDRHVEGDRSASREFITRITRGFSDPETVARLVREYIDGNGTGSQVDLNIVDEMVTRYVRQVKATDELTRNVQWSVDRIEFSNTFAYGPGNVIDFSKLTGITGIFAGNAMGKSSVIGTLMYALFNATDRGPMKNLHVINTRYDGCEARAVVTINGDLHEITRSTKKVTSARGDVSAVTSLQFSHIGSGETLNGVQRTSTEQRIRQAIGTADDFMLTSLAVQDGLKAFIREGASVRKAILTRVLDLQVFEHVHEHAKADSASIKARMRDLPERDWDEMFKQVTMKLSSADEELMALESDITDIRSKVNSLHSQLAGARPVSQDDIVRQRRAVAQLEESILKSRGALEDLARRHDVIEHGLMLVKRVRDDYDVTSLRVSDSTARVIERSLENLRARHDAERARLATQRRSAEKLKQVPCGESFPDCMYIRDSHRDARELRTLESLIDDIASEIAANVTNLTNMSIADVRKRLTRYERIVAKFDNMKRTFDAICLSISATRTTIASDEARLVELKASLSALEEASDDVVVIQQQRIRREIDDLNREVATLDDRRMKLAEVRGRNAANLERLQTEQAEYESMARDWRAYELIIAATSKRGVPSHVLRHLIPAINDEIARILHGIVKFTIELELPDDSNAMEVYIDYDGDRRLIELASGMEKMVASIAIRVALINVSNLPKTDMLIIDEGFSDLDETNIEACSALLRALTQWFRSIIIITHIDSLKDVVDNVIDIGREGYDATVNFT